jgi:hypothetical protein
VNEPRFPDFIIIGAMKAATSTLQVQLAAQPGIFMATPKEPNFFSDPEQWAHGVHWYRSLFAAAPHAALCGEASTHYTKLPTYPDALPRLAKTLPNIRLIYIMRHPIDRLISHYSHGWLERSFDEPIEEAIIRRPELVDYGRYAMQIAPWLDIFGPDAILPLFTERLAVAPQDELQRVGSFLGMADTLRWHEDLDHQNMSSDRLRDEPLRDWVVNQPVLATLRRRLVPRTIRARIKRHWQMPQKPMLSEQAIAKLATIFDPDLANLGKLLGVELNCTNFRTRVGAAALDWVGSDRQTEDLPAKDIRAG